MYKTILFAYDGSQEGQDALTDTKELALWGGSKVWLVAVNPGFEAFALAGGGGYHYSWDTADEVSADLIVVGHRHLDSQVARWWSGSISTALVEEAPCSVFCVIAKKP